MEVKEQPVQHQQHLEFRLEIMQGSASHTAYIQAASELKSEAKQ